MKLLDYWLPVAGYEGMYMVSYSGFVKNAVTHVILKGCEGHNGYLHLTLCKNGKHTTTRVSRIVATCYHDNNGGKLQVNHKDGVKRNNCANNLEWSTGSENQLHRYRVLRRGAAKGESAGQSKLKEFQVLEIRRLYNDKECHQSEIARRFNISTSTVAEILQNKIWKHLKQAI